MGGRREGRGGEREGRDLLQGLRGDRRPFVAFFLSVFSSVICVHRLSVCLCLFYITLAALVANKRIHLYLLLVYAFFIYLCCVISIKHDDDEHLRAVSDQKLAVRKIRLREIAVITA